MTPDTSADPPQKISFKRIAVVTAVAGALGVGALLAGNVYTKNVLPDLARRGRSIMGTAKDAGTPGEIAFGDKDRLNILLLGIDYNYTDQGVLYTRGARSDTMMVISVSKKGDLLNMLSVPRDTYAQITPKVGFDKINDAYAVGGAQQAMRTVSRFLGVPIDHYVVVKVYGAQKVFKALGGLTLDVEKNMNYDDNWAHFHVHLKKGLQKLNAEQCIGYARFRMDEEGDRGRMRRQQQVIQTLVAQLKSPSIVAKLPGLIKAVKNTLETDMDPVEIADLAHLYEHFDRKKVHSAQIQGGDATINGQSMLIPYQEINEKAVRDLLKDEGDLSLHDVHIEVLNGSGKDGMAKQTGDALRSLGFSIGRVGDAGEGEHATTQIYQRVDNSRIHDRLAKLFPGAMFVVQKDRGKKADYTVVLGTDFTPLTVTASAAPAPFNPDGTGPQGSAAPVSTPPPTRHESRATRRPAEPDQPALEDVKPTSPPPLENAETPPAPEPTSAPAPESEHAEPPAERPAPPPPVEHHEPPPAPPPPPEQHEAPPPPPPAPAPSAPAPAATPVPSGE